MCPSAPFSVPLDISASSTDEELILFVGGRKVGDPVPGNVITEVSPFSIEPRDSPEGIWYLYNPEDPQSLNGGCEIKVTSTGYWKSMDDLRIFTSTPTVGRKTTREFYEGKAPYGNKTRWKMHEYQAEQKTHLGINKEQDYCSLCRVFLQIDERPNDEEQHNSIIADAAHGDCLERVLLNLLEQEENNLSSRDAVNRSQAQFAVTVAVIWWQKGVHLPIQCLKGHGLPTLPLLLLCYLITGGLLIQANLQAVIQTNLLPVVHVVAGVPKGRDQRLLAGLQSWGRSTIAALDHVSLAIILNLFLAE